MILKNNKTVSAIYKGAKEIIKRYKGTRVIYEAFKRLIAYATLPLVLNNCKGTSNKSSLNVFNKRTMSKRIYAYMVGTTVWAYAEDSYSVRVPAKPNTTYRISTENEVTIFRAGCIETTEYPTASLWNVQIPIYNGVNQSNNTPITITTTENTKYIIIQSNNAYMEETLKTLSVVPIEKLFPEDEYERLEYIESTGTQHILTDVYPDQNTGFDVEFLSYDQIHGTAGFYGCIMGAREKASVNDFQISTYFNKNIDDSFKGTVRLGTDVHLNAGITPKEKMRCTLINKAYTNHRDVSWTNDSTFKSPQPLTVFALNNGGTITQHGKVRLYRLRLYSGSKLTHEFIPCLRKSESKFGLYDVANGVFHTNQGEGEDFKRSPYSLPQEYQELDYIESTGTQYINTGLVGKPGYTIETNLSFSALSTGNYQYFAGYSYTGSADRIYYIRLNNSSDHLGFTYGAQVINKITPPEAGVFCDIKSSMKADKQEFYINGELLNTSGYSALEYDEENPVYIYMFASQYIDTRTNGAMQARCKYAKWYDEDDRLIRYFIPCYRISDSEIGMFDLVENKFYTNQGTDPFLRGSEKVLPNTYQQLEYIESNGNQYIDTGFVPTRATKIEDTVSHMVSTSTATLFGAGGAENNRFQCYHGNKNDPRIAARLFSQGVIINITISDFTKKHVVIMDAENKIFEVQGIDQKTLTDGQGALFNYPITLFGNNMMGTIATQSAHRRYSFRAWDAGVLKRDMVPCCRKSDDVIGMYDLVEGVFYENKGTEPFIPGDIVTDYETSYKIYGNTVQQKLLPLEYQQVDYIESTGTQYLEINYIATDKTNSCGTYQITKTSEAKMLFGARYNANERAYTFNWGGGKEPYHYYNCYYESGQGGITSIAIDGAKHTFRKEAAILYLDDVAISDRTNNSFIITPYQVPGNMLVFGCNTNGNKTNLLCSARIYDLKFYDGDELKVDLIPCYRKSDNVNGMYDYVTGTFYTNQGTGQFTRGAIKTYNEEPSVDRPVHIECAGDKTENLIPNKFIDKEMNGITWTVRNDGAIVANGTATEKSYISIGFELEAGDYYFSGCPENGSDTSYRAIFYPQTDKVNYIDSGSGIQGKAKEYQRVTIQLNIYAGYTANNVVFKPMLIKGTAPKSFEPYGYKIPFTISGRNLLRLPIESLPTERDGINFEYKEDGSIVCNGTATANIDLTLTIFPLKAFTQYYCTGCPEGGSTSTYRMFFNNVGSDTGNGIAKRNTSYYPNCAARLLIYKDYVCENLTFKPMVVSGIEKADFTPYVEPMIMDIYLKEPLRKIGDYADYIDFIKGKVVRKNIVYTTTATEPWVFSSVYGDYVSFYVSMYKVTGYGTTGNTNRLNLICDKMPTINTTSDECVKCTGEVTGTSNGLINITLLKTTIGYEDEDTNEIAVEKLKAWLLAHPLTFVYAMNEYSEPIIEEITLPKLPLHSGVNTIDTDCEVRPSAIEIMYYGR